MYVHVWVLTTMSLVTRTWVTFQAVNSSSGDLFCFVTKHHISTINIVEAFYVFASLWIESRGTYSIPGAPYRMGSNPATSECVSCFLILICKKACESRYVLKSFKDWFVVCFCLWRSFGSPTAITWLIVFVVLSITWKGLLQFVWPSSKTVAITH